MITIILLSLLLGIFVGTLINYVAYKIRGNFKGTITCPACKHKIEARKIVPVISYFTTRQECPYCGKPIPRKYPIVEIVTGLVFTFIAYNINLNLFQSGITYEGLFTLIFAWFVVSYLIMVFVLDTNWQEVPEKLTSSAILLTMILLIVGTFVMNVYSIEELALRVLIAFGSFLVFFIVYILTQKKAISFSDVKLITFIALVLGFPYIIPSIVLTFLTGTIFGIMYVIVKHKSVKARMPFSPFLILGALLALIWGQPIIDLYLGLV
jgi:leader peptidase (prepilin peptidase)/N-methyltransferase